VLPEFRRRGLGEAMLRSLFRQFWDRGIRTVDLGVDSENRHGAIGLYLRSGMIESHSYEAYEKILREGKTWRGDD
jgi:mycothiol synthase